jgi:hypothetical protein
LILPTFKPIGFLVQEQVIPSGITIPPTDSSSGSW